MLISQMSFEKTFGLSSVFIESTLMENGASLNLQTHLLSLKKPFMSLAVDMKRKVNGEKRYAFLSFSIFL